MGKKTHAQKMIGAGLNWALRPPPPVSLRFIALEQQDGGRGFPVFQMPGANAFNSPRKCAQKIGGAEKRIFRAASIIPWCINLNRFFLFFVFRAALRSRPVVPHTRLEAWLLVVVVVILFFRHGAPRSSLAARACVAGRHFSGDAGAGIQNQ